MCAALPLVCREDVSNLKTCQKGTSYSKTTHEKIRKKTNEDDIYMHENYAQGK